MQPPVRYDDPADYLAAVNTLTDRLVAFSQRHPEILDIDFETSRLFRYPDLRLDDLPHALYEVAWALGKLRVHRGQDHAQTGQGACHGR